MDFRELRKYYSHIVPVTIRLSETAKQQVFTVMEDVPDDYDRYRVDRFRLLENVWGLGHRMAAVEFILSEQPQS